MIPIDTKHKPAPIDDEKNKASGGGSPFDLERAIVILQLPGDESGPFYTGAEIAGTKWQLGSPEYRKQGRRFNRTATNNLNPSNVDPKSPGAFLPTVSGRKTYAGWSAPALRGILSKEVYEEGTKFINEARRQARRSQKKMTYTFDGGGISAFAENEEPPWPDSHLVDNISPTKEETPVDKDPLPGNEEPQKEGERNFSDEAPFSPGSKNEKPILKIEISKRALYGLVAALILALGLALVKPTGVTNTKIYSSSYWSNRPVKENRELYNSDIEPLQREAITQGNAMQTNSYRPFVLDENRVMVACDQPRKFVVTPDEVIELGDWVVIPENGVFVRGFLVDLNIKWAILRTNEGEEKRVLLPYRKGWKQVSSGIRNIELLPMDGGNMRRVIEGWCSVRSGYFCGPLDDFSCISIIGQFDNFKQIFDLTRGEIGISLQGKRIFSEGAGARWYIRWENQYWWRRTLGEMAKETSARTGLKITVLDSDSDLYIEYGSKAIERSFSVYGVTSENGLSEIIWSAE